MTNRAKTMAELEAEDSTGFSNQTNTPNELAETIRLTAARRNHEAIYTPIADPSDEEDDEGETE
jgi:hypothetical protein